MKNRAKVHLFSIKKYVFSFIILLLVNACSFAQKKDDPQPKNQPKVHIDVNKEYDENGNIIRYDSTYSWTWSNIDSLNEHLNDSLISQFFSPKSMLSFSPFDDDSLLDLFRFPSFNDNFFDWGFDMDKQMESMLKRHHEMMLHQQELMNRLFKNPQNIVQPQPNPKPKIYLNPQQKSQSNNKTNSTSSSQNTGIDL